MLVFAGPSSTRQNGMGHGRVEGHRGLVGGVEGPSQCLTPPFTPRSYPILPTPCPRIWKNWNLGSLASPSVSLCGTGDHAGNKGRVCTAAALAIHGHLPMQHYATRVPPRLGAQPLGYLSPQVRNAPGAYPDKYKGREGCLCCAQYIAAFSLVFHNKLLSI